MYYHYYQKDNRLFIVSNCQDGYIEAFLKAHRLAKYFDDTECWGRTRTCKGESNKILIKRIIFVTLCMPEIHQVMPNRRIMRGFRLFMQLMVLEM